MKVLHHIHYGKQEFMVIQAITLNTFKTISYIMKITAIYDKLNCTVFLIFLDEMSDD